MHRNKNNSLQTREWNIISLQWNVFEDSEPALGTLNSHTAQQARPQALISLPSQSVHEASLESEFREFSRERVLLLTNWIAFPNSWFCFSKTCTSMVKILSSIWAHIIVSALVTNLSLGHAWTAPLVAAFMDWYTALPSQPRTGIFHLRSSSSLNREVRSPCEEKLEG